MLKLFQNRRFIFLSLSFLTSSVANWIYKLALPIIILDKTGSAFQAASMFGFSFVPWIIFSLLGGVIADSLTKSRVLFVGNLFATITSVLLVLTINVTPFPLFYIYCIVLCLSSVDPLIHPSFQSLIPEIASKDDYVNANSIIQTIENTLSVIGPLIGGGIVTILGGIPTLWFSVIFLTISTVSAALIHSNLIHKPINCKSIITDIKDGFNYVINEKVILSGSLMFFFANFGTNMFEANFMYFMTKELHLSVTETTITMAMSGIGSLLAGPIGSKIIPLMRSGKVLIYSTIMAGVTIMCLTLTKNYIVLGVILGIVGFLGTINVITYFTLRQKTVPKNMLGRVVSVTRMMSFASIPLGSLLGGQMLSAGISMIIVILIAGFIRTVTGIIASFTPLGKEI